MDGGESIGMMSGAYFVGRTDILRWVNELTGLSYSKIEQTASGIFACHVFDALFPEAIRFEKVKFDVKVDYDYVHNYKVLQGAFTRLKMKKQIDVQKLIKAKYQDNLEFMQWIKAFYDTHASDDALSYDGRARREELMRKNGVRPARPARQVRPALATNRPRVNDPSKRKAPGARTMVRRPVAAKAPLSRRTKPQEEMVSKAKYDKLAEENKKLNASIEDAETERLFYYNKLRDVEMIYQGVQEDVKDGHVDTEFLLQALDDIKNAMYAEDGEEDENPDAVENDVEGEYEDEELPPEEHLDDELPVAELSIH